MRKAVVLLEPTVGIWAKHLIQAIREKGFYSILVAPPSAVEEFTAITDQVIPWEKWDESSLRELRDELRKKRGLAAFFTGYGRFHAFGLHGETIARLAAEIELPHPHWDALYRTNNKFLTRDALAAAGVPTVGYALVRSPEEAAQEAERIGYPVILKPLNSVASSFICRCANAKEVREKFTFATKTMASAYYGKDVSYSYTWTKKNGESVYFNPATMMLLEQYIPGYEVSVEAIAGPNSFVPLMVHDKPMITEKETVVLEDIDIVPPVNVSPRQCKELMDYAKRVGDAVGLRNSLAHVELRYTPGCGPQLLEINPRVGGGINLQRSIGEFTGVKPPHVLVDIVTGNFRPQAAYPLKQDRMVGMFALFSPHGGVLQGYSGVDAVKALKGVEEVTLPSPVGGKIGGDHEECLLLTCYMTAKTPQQIFETYRKARSLFKFEIRN